MPSHPDKPDLPGQVLAEHFQVLLPSLPHWIEAGAEFLRQRAVLCGACGETRSGKLLVAMHEALANAVIHGNLEISSQLKEEGDDTFAQALAQRSSDAAFNERAVDITMDYDGQRCQWTITDEGSGFDVEAVLARSLSDDPEILLASGRGILMMRSFLDEVHYEENGRRLILVMTRESGRERRHKPRLPRREPLHVVPVRPDGSADWEAAYDAVARNLSEQGIGLFQDQLAHTDRILIGLNVAGSLVYLPAQVRHCKNVAGNLVELGCTFLSEGQLTGLTTKVCPPEDLEKVHQAINVILQASPALAHDDRRAFPRVLYNERVEIIPTRSDHPVIGYARDLSRGGLALVTTAPLALDTALLLLPQRAGPPLRVLSLIVRCDKIQDNFFDVGARFLNLEEPASSLPSNK